MTYEAEQAKKVGYQFEAKKDALRQTQGSGVKVTLSIQPHDMPPQLYGDAMGQRYVCVIVPINDDETPRLVPATTDTPDKPKSYAGQAKMLAKEDAFQKFVAMEKKQNSCYGEGEAEQWIEHVCAVKSCSELIEGTEAGKKFKRLQAEYLSWRDR